MLDISYNKIKQGSRVIIQINDSFHDQRLHGKKGTVKGISALGYVYVYIVLLDEPINRMEEMHEAVSISGSNLKICV